MIPWLLRGQNNYIVRCSSFRQAELTFGDLVNQTKCLNKIISFLFSKNSYLMAVNFFYRKHFRNFSDPFSKFFVRFESIMSEIDCVRRCLCPVVAISYSLYHVMCRKLWKWSLGSIFLKVIYFNIMRCILKCFNIHVWSDNLMISILYWGYKNSAGICENENQLVSCKCGSFIAPILINITS